MFPITINTTSASQQRSQKPPTTAPNSGNLVEFKRPRSACHSLHFPPTIPVHPLWPGLAQWLPAYLGFLPPHCLHFQFFLHMLIRANQSYQPLAYKTLSGSPYLRNKVQILQQGFLRVVNGKVFKSNKHEFRF